MSKITFEDKVNKNHYGACIKGDRNQPDEIKVYKDSPDKLKTLIHELIHDFLYKRSSAGHKSRIMDKLNDDEGFVDGLAIRIKEGLSDTGFLEEGKE